MSRNKSKPELSVPRWQIVRYLRRGFRTARDLARWVGCSRIHAYRLIEILTESEEISTRRVRENATGPKARAYRIV